MRIPRMSVSLFSLIYGAEKKFVCFLGDSFLEKLLKLKSFVSSATVETEIHHEILIIKTSEKCVLLLQPHTNNVRNH